jgi:hypothetical protein
VDLRRSLNAKNILNVQILDATTSNQEMMLTLSVGSVGKSVVKNIVRELNKQNIEGGDLT